MRDLDTVFRELSEARRQLEDLPDDAFGERARLESRLEGLRAEVSELEGRLPDERPTSVIRAELESLRHRLHEIESAEIDIITQHGGSGLESSGTVSTFELNQRIDAAQGGDEIRNRIKQLERILDDRGEPHG